jgi:hypothetical protein
MSEYRDPTDEERQLRHELVGRSISIYWDGDDAYYGGLVVGFDETAGKFKVKYDGDDTGDVYDENFASSKWRITDGEPDFSFMEVDEVSTIPAQSAPELDCVCVFAAFILVL